MKRVHLLYLDATANATAGKKRGDQRLRFVVNALYFLRRPSTEHAQHQVESATLLDVAVGGESAAGMDFLAGENEALLVGGNALVVLDLGLDSIDGVGRLH